MRAAPRRRSERMVFVDPPAVPRRIDPRRRHVDDAPSAGVRRRRGERDFRLRAAAPWRCGVDDDRARERHRRQRLGLGQIDDLPRSAGLGSDPRRRLGAATRDQDRRSRVAQAFGDLRPRKSGADDDPGVFGDGARHVEILPRRAAARYHTGTMPGTPTATGRHLTAPVVLLALAALAAACGGGHRDATSRDWLDLDVGGADHPLAGYRAHFLITWQDRRVGDAVESLEPQRDVAGLRYTRHERTHVRRDGVASVSQTDLVIDTDPNLRALRVRIRQVTEAAVAEGLAERGPDGEWQVSFTGEPERRIDGDAVPMELVPLLLATRKDRHFTAPILMAGYGFAVGALTVEPDGDDAVRATVATPLGSLAGRLQLGAAGTVTRVVSADGAGAVRVSANAARAPFDPPELLTTATLAVARAGARTTTFELAGVTRIEPPPLPGQRIHADGNRWRIELARGDRFTVPADTRSASLNEVTALVRRVADAVEDDMATIAANAHAALELGRGDCTTHALAFAAAAQDLNIPVRLVTGYRLDPRGILVRHRWALVPVDGHWIAVDPTFGEAPASGRLFGLLLHDGSAADLGVSADIAYAGLARATARALD